jgi:hypothetical protein
MASMPGTDGEEIIREVRQAWDELVSAAEAAIGRRLPAELAAPYQLRAAGIAVRVERVERVERRWHEDIDDVLSWTARESMTNILRHSHARNAVIILSGDADLVRLRVRQAMDTGARGFMIKDRPVPELVDAIRRMAAGALIIDPDLAVSALDLTPNPLSEREREVLRASAGGPTIRVRSLRGGPAKRLDLTASSLNRRSGTRGVILSGRQQGIGQESG